MARGYKTVDELLPEMEQMISDLRFQGVQTLPSERQLAKETGSSVMTLRKVLSILEERRLFVKHNRVRMITEIDSPKKQTVNSKVVFIAMGQHSPVNVTWMRLSFMLSEQLREIGADFTTVCINSNDTRETIEKRIGDLPQVIIFADSPTPRVQMEVLSMKDKCFIIGVDENLVGKCESVVGLNNYQAGYLAAEKLIEAGCKRPAMNYTDKGYCPFYQRRDGFRDVLLRHNLPVENCFYLTKGPGEPYPGDLVWPDAIEKICKAGHDGLFLFTDTLSQHTRETILKYYKIPEEFRLITLDSTGEFNDSMHQISAVSHGLEEATEKIVNNLTAFVNGSFFEKIQLVNSVYIPGCTL